MDPSGIDQDPLPCRKSKGCARYQEGKRSLQDRNQLDLLVEVGGNRIRRTVLTGAAMYGKVIFGVPLRPLGGKSVASCKHAAHKCLRAKLL